MANALLGMFVSLAFIAFTLAGALFLSCIAVLISLGGVLVLRRLSRRCYAGWRQL